MRLCLEKRFWPSRSFLSKAYYPGGVRGAEATQGSEETLKQMIIIGVRLRVIHYWLYQVVGTTYKICATHWFRG